MVVYEGRDLRACCEERGMRDVPGVWRALCRKTYFAFSIWFLMLSLELGTSIHVEIGTPTHFYLELSWQRFSRNPFVKDSQNSKQNQVD